MENKWILLINALRKLTYQNIISIFLFCVILLGSYAGFKYIQQVDFVLQGEKLTPKQMYLKEFQLKDLTTALRVKEILTEVRISTGATHVALLGYHNGIAVGPFPFRKVSILDESIKPGTASLMRQYQDIPLNMLLDITVDLWKSPNRSLSIFREDIETKYPGVYYEMLNNNFWYTYQVSISIANYQSPIGVIWISYSKEDYQKAFKDQESKNKIYQILNETSKKINFIFTKLEENR